MSYHAERVVIVLILSARSWVTVPRVPEHATFIVSFIYLSTAYGKECFNGNVDDVIDYRASGHFG